MKFPYVSKQKGRMTDLLKTKSKVQVVMKERVKYTPYDFEKRVRDSSGNVRNIVV